MDPLFGRPVSAVLLAAAVAACTRSAPKSDASFEKAQRLYQQLYAVQLDDAYGDPKMDQVATLLGTVDPDSADGPSAKAMLHSIEAGRATLAKEREARAKMAATASQGIKAINLDPDRILAASAPPDAGPPPDAYGAGASLAELNATTGGCLVGQESFTERGTGKTGVVYRLSGSAACASALPGFVGQAVLVSEGRLYRRLDDATLPKPLPPQQATPAGLDAGLAQARPQGAAAGASSASGGATGAASPPPQNTGPAGDPTYPAPSGQGYGQRQEETGQALPDGGLP